MSKRIINAAVQLIPPQPIEETAVQPSSHTLERALFVKYGAEAGLQYYSQMDSVWYDSTGPNWNSKTQYRITSKWKDLMELSITSPETVFEILSLTGDKWNTIHQPSFVPTRSYRVRKPPVVVYAVTGETEDGTVQSVRGVWDSLGDTPTTTFSTVAYNYNITGKLKLSFDPRTHQLMSAEVVK